MWYVLTIFGGACRGLYAVSGGAVAVLDGEQGGADDVGDGGGWQRREDRGEGYKMGRGGKRNI